MKNFKLLIIVLFVFTGSFSFTDVKAQSVNISFSTFQQELSPYGRWMNNPRFGQVWVYNDVNFKPYNTGGHWEYTNYGWSWESDYDWGWAPFHYGRWEYDPYIGWMWLPGYEWASAWVSWSNYDDYYGWAPLGYGVNINVSFGSIPYNNWNFIPRRDICQRNLSPYYVSYQRDNRFRNAVVINNYYNGNGHVGHFVRGPERSEVERYTNNRIQERRIDYNDRNRNRDNNVRNDGNNNSSGRRNNDMVRQDNNNSDNGNNRRRQDANTNNNNNSNGRQPNENRGQQPNDVRPTGRRNAPEANPNSNPGNDNNRPGRNVRPNDGNNPGTTPPVIDNRRPDRNTNTLPQRNDNNKPQRQIERTPPQQQREPVMQQRNMERRNDNNRNVQQSNTESRTQNSGSGKRGRQN